MIQPTRRWERYRSKQSATSTRSDVQTVWLREITGLPHSLILRETFFQEAHRIV